MRAWLRVDNTAGRRFSSLIRGLRRAVSSSAIIASACIGCDQASPPTPAGDDSSHADPAPVAESEPTIGGAGMNVLFVSVDTTRADHIGCYGHPDVKTPNIDRMAAEGTRFAQSISSAPLTLPSHATMLTGSQPYVHGARDNGIFILAEENVTLPEIFKEAGYATHGEVAALVLGRKTHLNQGFDTYGDVEVKRPDIGPWKKEENAAALAVEGAGGPEMERDRPQVEIERKAGEITDRGIELLHEKVAADERFFIFLHYFDPHWPHEAPERFASQYKDGYYAEIAFFDEQFGRLLQSVRDLGLAEKTLVILTSDHGEGRGQHGEQTHSTFLYDTTLHVPLLMWCPGQVPAGQVVETQVRTVDLAPTILEFAWLADRQPEQFQGVSLLPLLEDPAAPIRLASYSDTVVPRTTYGYCPLRAIRAAGWKYILSPAPELYHVAEDPLELYNIAAAEPSRAADLRRELRDMIANSPDPPGGRGALASIDPEELRRLEALGYVSSSLEEDPALTSGSELEQFEPKGVNPRDRIEVVNCMASGLGTFRVGMYEEGAEVWKRFYELEPDNPTGPSYLGRIYTILERYDEAIEWFERVVEMQPDRYIDQRNLGHAYLKQQRFEDALRAYGQAAEHDADDYASRMNRGRLFMRLGRHDEALETLAHAERIAPEVAAVHFERGMAYKAAQQADKALECFRETLRLNPQFVRAHAAISGTLRQAGKLDEAIEYLEKAVADIPDSGLLVHGLAQGYVAKQDNERAGACFARVAELMPDNAAAQKNMGVSLSDRGRDREAVAYFRKAVELDSGLADAWLLLAGVLETIGELDEASQSFDRLIEQCPRFPAAYRRYANCLDRQDCRARAIEVLRQGHELMPKDPLIANDLSWRLATSPQEELRDGARAVELAEQARAAAQTEAADVLDTLAAAYAAAGRFDDAVETAKRAVAAATEAEQTALAARISARLELYETQRPFLDQ